MSTSHPTAEDSQSPTLRLPADSDANVTAVPKSNDSGTHLIDPVALDSATAPRALRHYVLLRELGRGGMGIVYEAEDQVLRRKVAIKVLPPAIAADADLLARFRRESESAAQLDHPGIVKVFGIGTDEGVPFFVMERVDGFPLDNLLALGRLSFRDAARVARAASEALAYAHSRGVIHRDIKPGNLMIVGAKGPALPEDLRVVITDFGLATGANYGTLTRSGDVLGTPAYMSPEQAGGAGTGVDHRTDLYALGATLYEMATGKKPFEGEATGSLLHRVIHEDVIPPRRIDPRIPKDLETMVLKLMEKDPARRYASGQEAAEDLTRFLAEEPIRARAVSVVGRMIRKARKNKSAAALIVLLISSVTLGPAVWFGLRLHRQRETEKKIEAAEKALLEGNPSRAFFLVSDALARDPDNPRARLVREEADRGRREGEDLVRAGSRLAEAEACRHEGDALWAKASDLRKEAIAQVDLDPAKMKELRAQQQRAEKEARSQYGRALGIYHEALGVAPRLTEAADRAVDVYLAYHARDEEEGAWGDAADMETFVRGLLDRCSPQVKGRTAAYLEGTGRASLSTDPPSRLEYFQVAEKEGKFLPVSFGEWPGGEVPLAMGSWLAVASAEGYAETRIPIWVPRQGSVELHVKLRKQREVGGGYLFVSGGGFWMGGDEKAFGAGPRRWVEVPDFAIGQFEVTCEEYGEFLNALSHEVSTEVAIARAPRQAPTSGFYWKPDDRGWFAIPRGWDARWPICSISRGDAEAYAAWKSKRDGVAYRLPSEKEWEKAARGVDGRTYPWGNDWDDRFCVCRSNPMLAGGSHPLPVGAAVEDESPYGVRDMAGSVAEWTSDFMNGDRRSGVRRGAAWGFEAETCHAAARIGSSPEGVSMLVGFRLVHDFTR